MQALSFSHHVLTGTGHLLMRYRAGCVLHDNGQDQHREKERRDARAADLGIEGGMAWMDRMMGRICGAKVVPPALRQLL